MFCRIGLSTALLALPLGAQLPSSFGELALPGGASASSLQQIGKIAVYDDGNSFIAWSSHTRKWRGVSHSPQATLRIANDWALVQDGSSWLAFSSMRGVWSRLTPATSAAVVNPASQRNDSLVLVRAGNTVHAFSGFSGRWVSQAISATASIAVQRHVAVAADGTTAWGLGAFDMQWRSVALPSTGTRPTADGFGGSVEAGADAFAYSAQTRAWSSARLPGGALQRFAAGDVQIWIGGPIALAYSAMRGSFANQTTGAGSPTVLVDRQLASVATASGVSFFSAPLASWTRTSIPSSALQSLNATLAILTEANRVHAYSALSGSVATRNVAVTAVQTTRALGACLDQSGKPLLYSAMSGTWSDAPANALARPAALVAHAALVETSAGFSAYSARTASFVPLSLASGASVLANPATSILGVSDAQRLYVFDDRSLRWLSRGRATTQVPAVWRTVLMGDDGSQLVGFASQTGRFETRPVPANGGYSLRASSELVTALHSKGIWAFSATPDFLTAAQFPEFRRIFVIGSVLPIYLSAPASSAVLPLLGARRSSQATPFGLLDLDLATLTSGAPIAIGSEGVFAGEIPIPNQIALRGAEIAWQAFVLPPQGSPYLTRSAQTSIR